jgi:alpha-galactosidase
MKNGLCLFVSFVLTAMAVPVLSQAMPTNPNAVTIKHITADFPVEQLDNKTWKNAREVEVKTNWSGLAAPPGRHFKARLLWSDTALYVRFEAAQAEPLVVSEKPDLTRKAMNLWDRDVCEIFVAPDREDPERYFEFEVAPTGEWIDLAIHVTPGKRITNWEYRSGMRSAARIEKDRVVMAIRIEWQALNKKPQIGDVWLGNLFRCVGSGENRGYLAWQPTRTETPNFHVPEKFGMLEFVR